jgi:hypothetical protein
MKNKAIPNPREAKPNPRQAHSNPCQASSNPHQCLFTSRRISVLCSTEHRDYSKAAVLLFNLPARSVMSNCEVKRDCNKA